MSLSCCIAPPKALDAGAAFDHLTTGRQHVGIGRVHRRHRRRVALVEGGGPLVIQFLDIRLALRQRRRRD
jgi:hypothetical protein